MMHESKWARIKHAGAHGLRRGTWYPVVDDADPDLVVVEVNRKRVPIGRSAIELAPERPLMWTVVVLASGNDGPADLGPRYGVCPNCLARAALKPDEAERRCPGCDMMFAVDWS